MLSANTARSQGWSGFTRLSRSPRPSASWMSAACTTTPSSSPSVSTATWRLRPFSRFAASQPRGPPLSVVFTLWVSDDRRRGAGLPPGALAQHDHEVVADALPHAVAEEGAHVAVHRASGREGRRGWQVSPLAAGAHEVEEAVQQVPHVRASR